MHDSCWFHSSNYLQVAQCNTEVLPILLFHSNSLTGKMGACPKSSLVSFSFMKSCPAFLFNFVTLFGLGQIQFLTTSIPVKRGTSPKGLVTCSCYERASSVGLECAATGSVYSAISVFQPLIFSVFWEKQGSYWLNSLEDEDYKHFNLSSLSVGICEESLSYLVFPQMRIKIALSTCLDL